MESTKRSPNQKAPSHLIASMSAAGPPKALAPWGERRTAPFGGNI